MNFFSVTKPATAILKIDGDLIFLKCSIIGAWWKRTSFSMLGSRKKWRNHSRVSTYRPHGPSGLILNCGQSQRSVFL